MIIGNWLERHSSCNFQFFKVVSVKQKDLIYWKPVHARQIEIQVILGFFLTLYLLFPEPDAVFRLLSSWNKVCFGIQKSEKALTADVYMDF